MAACARVNRLWLPVLIAIALVCQGCANTIESAASDIGMVAATLQSEPFRHRIYSLASDAEASDSVKVVLVDGDGRAFINPTTVARDPTPIRSSLLMMAPQLKEIGSVIYLGRPCYHRLQDPQCNPLHWTLARYGPAVISSSVLAIKQLIQPEDQVILVGYSGGGVIAMLIAREIHSRVLGVVTYGSPLDTDAWADFHGYTRLGLSENPAKNADSFKAICQLHLFGDRDQVVPEQLIATWHWHSPKQASMVSSDHFCCWQSAMLHAARSLPASCVAN